MKKDSPFWDWRRQVRGFGAVVGGLRSVTVSLMDGTGKPTMVWTLTNAWPTEVTSTDLEGSGDEVAVDSIEFALEGMTVAGP